MEAVGDGAPWIWNLVAERWAQATQVLDFYHASEHLWTVARLLDTNVTDEGVNLGALALKHGFPAPGGG